MKESADVVIVGGGIVGLACAWRAAQRGMEVAVLEREPRLGAGASGVAAGMLAPVGEAHVGAPGRVALTLAAHGAWPSFAADLGAASGTAVAVSEHGALRVGLDRDEAEELRRLHSFQVDMGLETEWLGPSACRELEPGLSPGLRGGIWAAHEAAVDPRLVVEALARACGSAGVSLRPGCPVTGLHGGPGGWRLEAGGSGMTSAEVVCAAGAWSGTLDWLPPSDRPPVRPVKGEVVRLRGATEEAVCTRIVASPRVYVVPRPDGEVVVGATQLDRGYDTTVTAGGVHELLREAYRALPDIAELEFVEASAGLRPGTPDNAPVIGRGPAGIVLATGHHRNGILLAPVTADAIAAILAGDDPPEVVAGFGPDRFQAVG